MNIPAAAEFASPDNAATKRKKKESRIKYSEL